MVAHKSTYTIKRPEKYKGDSKTVTSRSSWERSTFLWCERNPLVKYWNSEGVVVPYHSVTDNKQHRYFVDLYLEMTDGKIYLIEIKPAAQTKPPIKSRGKPKAKLLGEALTYIKNQEKWKAAEKFARGQGWVFQVWTEDTLKRIGVKLA